MGALRLESGFRHQDSGYRYAAFLGNGNWVLGIKYPEARIPLFLVARRL
jgi:hypothetical protein